jgi:hypothetical protein
VANDKLHNAIQRTAAEDEDLNGSVLMGWVVVAEWMSPEGQKWLSRSSGDARGMDCSDWTVKGYLNDVLDDLRTAVVFVSDEDEE